MNLSGQVCGGLVLAILSLTAAETKANQGPVHEVTSRLPMRFEVNQGQTDSRVRFLSRGSGYTFFLTPTEAVLSLLRQTPGAPESASRVHRRSDALRIKLLAANPAPRIFGIDQLPGKINYFIGSDPKKWQTDVSTFSKVKYEDVYPGIDLIYYGNQRELEHDFIVAPGADPSAIRLSIRGATKSRIDPDGDLVLSTPGGTVLLHRPLVYQDGVAGRQSISGRYAFRGSNRVGFEIDSYDVSKPVIIDPVLSYATYLGGSSNDIGIGIAVDAAGNAYITGQTNSGNFPTTQGALRTTLSSGAVAFVTKLNPQGNALLYSTFLGGTGSSVNDSGIGIAVDSAGNAYVIGQTNSANFPTTTGALQTTFAGGPNDAFIAKLNPQGNALLYSTFLGGTGDESGNYLAVDSAGNAYVTGQTNSANFPTTPGALQTTFAGGPNDAFVAKLNSQGNALLYSTFLGGMGDESGNGIAVDGAGNAYVTGTTDSANFPTTPGAFQSRAAGGGDAFVTKVNAAGNGLVYSTYLGGSTSDQGFAIALDSTGAAYVTGTTDSANFPTTPGAFQSQAAGGGDAFVAKFDPTDALAYSTFLGGNGADRGFAIAVSSTPPWAGNAFITGRTDSTDFPTERAIQPAASGGPGKAFVTELNAAGNALVYSTYLGGTGRDRGFAIALDSSRNTAYVTGWTDSTNFPTTSGAFQTAPRGMRDAVVVKIDDSAPDFEVVASSHSAGVNCGQTASYDLQLVPLNGFTGSVSINCTLAAQGMASTQGLTCRTSASSVNVTGGAVPFSVSVVTTGRSTLPPMATHPGPSNGERSRPVSTGTLVLGVIAIAVGLLSFILRRLKAPLAVASSIVIVALATGELVGCFGGGSHAIPGVYTVTVSGTNQSVTRSANLTLAVECPR